MKKIYIIVANKNTFDTPDENNNFYDKEQAKRAYKKKRTEYCMNKLAYYERQIKYFKQELEKLKEI